MNMSDMECSKIRRTMFMRRKKETIRDRLRALDKEKRVGTK
ncbi:MAG: hypothetical protein WB706_13170 [Nitrososphaeraceae archaeon]